MICHGTTVYSIIFYVLQLENDRTYTFSLIKNMDSSRGYPVSFVKQPPSEIPAECPICLDILCQPKVVSCCGHSFCAVCIGRVASSHKPCPLCGRMFTLSDNMWLERTLNGYKVHCPHQEKGCKWTGELAQLEHHLNQDPLPDKLLEGCQFQDIPCTLCQLYRSERQLMADHVSNDCPNRDIECEYSSVGCDVKKPQHQLAVHMREAASVHLLLFKTFTKNSLSEKENDIDELKRELRQQREQSDKKLREIQQQIEKIERKQSRAAQYWTLFVVVLIGALSIAYLFPTALMEATNNHYSRIEEIHNWTEELNETMNSLSSEVERFSHDHKSLKKELRESISSLSSAVERMSHDHNLTKKELRESINSFSSEVEQISHDINSTKLRESIKSLSSAVENVRHDQHLIEKELKQAMNNLSSTVEKINGSQYLIEKRLKESMENRLHSEVERVRQSQQIMEGGINESSIKVAKLSGELSDSVTQMQSIIHQLKSNADTATVAFEKVSQDVEHLKANFDGIKKQMATNGEGSKKQDDALKCSLRLTQDFFINELSTCGCVGRGFATKKFYVNGNSIEKAESLARQEGLHNRLAISLERNTCGA